ncbi:MAG TPA: phosphatase PAP2 family protein [Gemmatimonadaceae bacterium]|nr:phosphatase PAP2 family protein [Gemmatimonadaceae bacterium]
MNVAPLRASSTDDSAESLIRLAGALAVAHLVVGVAPMAIYVRRGGTLAPLLAHLVALSFGAVVLASRRRSLRPLRDWLPLLLGPFLYIELRWLIAGVGRPHADALIQGWELALFPSNPAATWASALPLRWLSEALHFAYASYYLLVYVPPALLYLRGRRDAYAVTLLALAVVYGVCFLTYVVFPVDGPRFLTGPATAPDGPIRSFVVHLLQTGSSRGTAFPSSHVAASVVASLAALRYQRRVGIVVAVLTGGLAVGAVYGGYHYLVDVLVGAIVGVVAWLLARALCRALSTPGAQSASAA